MRIPSQTVANGITAQLASLATQQARLQTQVSTGQRIFQSSDDPTAVADVMALQTERSQIQQYSSNADRALQVSQASYSGLQAVKSLSDRAGEIATLGTGTLSTSDAASYADETDQLLEQGVQEANAKSGSDYLYGGTATSAAPFTVTRDSAGQITGVAYAGAASSAAIPVSENSTLTPGTSGTTNQQLADFLNHLVSLRDALNSSTPSTGVQAVSAGLATSEDNLIGALSDQGSVQTRIEADQSTLTSRFQANQQQSSGLTDADLPSTIIKLTQTQTAYQAALQSSAKVMNLSLMDYLPVS